jgi:hypothetical protein
VLDIDSRYVIEMLVHARFSTMVEEKFQAGRIVMCGRNESAGGAVCPCEDMAKF